MNNESPESHIESHILDQIPVYLTGGLNAVERKSFESHVAGCPACAAAMFEAKAMDDSLRSMFDDVSPDRGFEDRLVARFRQKTTQAAYRKLHPMVRRAAIGVAATILVGSAGVFFQRNIQRRREMAPAAMASAAVPAMNPPSAMKTAVDLNGGTFTLDGRSLTRKDAQVSSGRMDTFWSASHEAENGKETETRHSFTGSNTLYGPTVVTNGGLATAPRNSAGSGGREVVTVPNPGLLISSGKDRDFGGSGNIVTDASGIADQELLATANKPAPSLNGPVQIAPVASPTPSVKSSPPIDVDAASVKFKLPVGQPTGVTYYGAASTIDNSGAIGVMLGSVAGANESGPVGQRRAAFFTDRSDVQVAEADQKQGEERKETLSGSSAFAAPAAGGPAAPATPSPQQTARDENQLMSRKIIREGELTFEIDSFDSTVMTIGKIVAEEGGFVSTTDSDKLANGKVKGTVVVRVPPDHLDTLVLKLRGVGDLKSQKITAQDITKQYTDLESELRAARAMQDRLLEIIKTGKGAVKDLLEAEKQLGVWREKIEQVEGELRYDNSLVSLSTLSISLMERDIKSAAFSSINEQVTMALETEKVEEAYNAAREAIDNAKGRIIQSELKQYDAGQFGATIRAQLPPDAADAVIGRIRQLDGRVANFQRARNQSDEGGSAAPLDASKVKRENVTLSLTIYNLANIAPRRTTTLTLAAGSVEDAYTAILDQAAKAGARVVASDLNRSRPEQSTGTITLSAPSEKADALLATVRSDGEMLGQENSDNPDTQNVTNAKRGLIVQLISVANVQARQSETLQLAAADVPGAFTTLLDALRSADARIIASQLNQQDPANKSATIVFDISRAARPPIDGAIDKVGEIVSRNITRSQDTANTLDSKVHVEMTLQSADVLPARQTTTLGVEVPDVQKSVDDLVGAAGDLGGREIDKDISQDQNGRSIAHVIVEVPLDKADGLSERIESWGHRRAKELTHNQQAPVGKLARGRLEVTLADAATSLGGQETTWDAIRNGLSVSGQALRWSTQMIVVGICFVAPVALVIWIGWHLFRRGKKGAAPAAAPTSA